VQSICDRLLTKDAEIDLMFCCIKPRATAKMQKAFETQYKAKTEETGKTFTVIQLFNQKEEETKHFHFVLVLDESGSMSGTPWAELSAAYQGFLNRRDNDQGANDFFTVVQFSTTARPTCKRQPLAQTPRTLAFGGGGTNYYAGLNEADKEIANDKSTSTVVMIFMSDGGDTNKQQDPIATMRQIKQKYANHNFKCHTVGFGNDVKAGTSAAQLLTNLASAGGGEMHYALTGLELLSVFGKIAADSTVSGTLVHRFSEILARDISVKIAVDYL
jgi:uncharacterized protein YegL